MSRRKRKITIAVVLVLLVVGEIGLRVVRGPVASVRIINEGGAPLENLRLSCGPSIATVSRLADGASATRYLTGRGRSPLSVSFQQKDNPLNQIEIAQFNPAALSRDGSTLVLVIRQNEVERRQEESEPSLLGRLATRAQSWLMKALASP